MRIRGIHHVTLAVPDAEEARATFEALFDTAGEPARAVPAFGIRASTIGIGDATLEFASPVDADNPVRRFIERKGEGFYALALEVDDIDAAVRELAAKGVKVSEPVESEPGVRSAFVTMAATHGLSIQLVEVVGGEEEAPVTTVVEARAEHLVPEEAAAADAPPLDLTPDEWSDVD